jgi:hypothetical protein
MSNQISLYDVPHKAVLALAFGMSDPEQVLRDFGFEQEQARYLLRSPELERAVTEQRRQLEKTGEMDQARVRMHAIAHMEHCTTAVAARSLKEVDVKYLDVLFKGAGIGAKQAVQADTGPKFSITFNLKPPAGRVIEGTAAQVPNINIDLTALAGVALPTEEF